MKSASQWAQALGPLESSVEHGTDRTHIAHLIEAHYADPYAALFGPLPTLDGIPDHASPNGLGAALDTWLALDETEAEAVNRVFANVGKAIAACERTITPQPSRFDDYVDRLAAGEDTSGIRRQIGAISVLP